MFGLLSWLFSSLASWYFVSRRERVILELYLVIESILKKFCWVLFPLRVSRDKCCVSCDCVSLSDPIYAMVI